MESGIYEITNTINGHRYVGSAVDLKKRWRNHKSALAGNSHHSIYLQRAWSKYGEDAFVFDVLEYWEPEFLVSMEQWWMNMLKPGYNILRVAGSSLGLTHTDETKEKMSVAQMGHRRNVGRKHTDEHKAKISSTLTGHKRTPETRARMSSAQMGNTSSLGYKRTAEERANISARLMGNTNALGNTNTLGHALTEEHKAKLSKAHMGHKTSAETRAKISAALKGKKLTKEHKAKLSAVKKGKPWSALQWARYEERKRSD